MGKPKFRNIETLQCSSPTEMSTGSSNFVQILHSVVSAQSGPVIWSETAHNTIKLNLLALDNYLNTEYASQFEIQTVHDFLRQLNLFGFKRLPSLTSDSIKYQHEFFQRDQPKLLSQIIVHTISSEASEKVLLATRRSETLMAEHRTLTDTCRMRANYAIDDPSLEKIMLEMAVAMFQLDREISKDSAEIPAEFYENPEQSVSNLMRPEFAGYYGLVTDDAIKEFFGTFLPVYCSDNLDRSQVGKRSPVRVRSDERLVLLDSAKMPGSVSQQRAGGNDIDIGYSIKDEDMVEEKINIEEIDFETEVDEPPKRLLDMPILSFGDEF